MTIHLKKHGPVKGANVAYTLALNFTPATAVELAGMEDKPEGFIAGWASTPDMDSYGHVVKTGAFDAAISTRGLYGPKSIKLLIGHDWDKLGGVIQVLETRAGRLWIEAQLDLGISYAKDAYLAAKISGGTNFSVGFMLQDYEWKETADKREYLLINRGDLYEVSVVPFPGNEECTMEFIKSRLTQPQIASVADFEKHLRDTGLVKSRDDARRITQVVKTAFALFAPGEQTAPVAIDPPEPLEDQRPLLDAAAQKSMGDTIARMKALFS